MRALNLEGQRFGRLVCQSVTVVYGRRGWLCQCDCGKTVKLPTRFLTGDRVRACGCGKTTHGMSTSTEYNIWRGMWARCTNQKKKAYKNYGGRGISVCTRWLMFQWFYKDMGPRPPGMTLDRKDNDKGYNKANCRWATRSEQERNKRPRSRARDNSVAPPAI